MDSFDVNVWWKSDLPFILIYCAGVSKVEARVEVRNLPSPSICQAFAITLSRFPLFAEIVIISDPISRGSITLNVCSVSDENSDMSGASG